MPIQLIDSHCHLTAPELSCDIANHIETARKVGVTGFVLPGVTAQDWSDQLNLAQQYNTVYPTAGLHPLFLDNHKREHLDQLKTLCTNKQIVAVGEIGLDFYEGKSERQQQTELFEQQVLLARSADLPIILHVRKAHDEVLAILRKTGFASGGTVHAYNGSMQQARQYINLGFYMGIGGSISYERAKKRRQLAKELPLESIILETDAPYMPLAGHQNEPNLPHYLPNILHILTELRREPKETLADQILINTKSIFKLPGYNRPQHS